MQSLRTKLIAFIVVLTFGVTALLSGAAYFRMRAQVIDGLNSEIRGVATGYNAALRNWIFDKQEVVAAGAKAIASASEPAAALLQVEKSAKFEVAYLGTAEKTMIPSHPLELPAGYDPTSRPWYQQAASAGEPILTPPYVDAASKRLIVSFAAPVKLDGQLKGVLGTDIYLDQVVKDVLGIKLTGNGYAFLANKEGIVLAHAKPDMSMKPTTDLSPDLAAGKLGAMAESHALQEIAIDGDMKYFYLQSIEGTPFYLALVIDKSAVLSSLNTLLMMCLGALVVVLVIIIPLASTLVNQLLSGLTRVRNAMQEIAQGQGDLTRKIDVAGNDEIAQTADAFNRFVAQLRNMFSELRQETGRLTQGVAEINSVLSELSRDSQQLSDLSASNAATIEQITVSISHIAENAHDANDLVGSTAQLSGESASTVRDVAREVGKSADEVEELSTLLGRLSQRSQEISGIIQVIKEIADQTNLLALNAAIEAARAGEQGRGFAVVADEVRKLAERTGQATLQITSMIDGVRTETDAAVGNMQKTHDAVQSGVALSDTAAGKIAHIRENMDAVIQKMGEIAHATREQQNATTAMAQSAESITNKMQASDHAMQRATDTVHQLKSMADFLEQMFGRFRF
ncbi:methyl-accepting chemotaxis sensory transducer with Cache sensor [Andreprevotia lacus DSM 23236]|jgi:methyl-accepting chemotaxis protein|uniref:Methyl-accepting chemotaxis sensory transducer with Cache sensor n=1 Tax=Andreprevotia lacus DSM 23236 TaxID=1121001 RepID=A0A1W1XE84_9NEIS|nr:methyl-accepting chemotaxis protein [Andreprevotia lacus]SMC22197.1 methyl-accepting chemotaxis sensory transducer with Cache sensor [Andreprevotia lacus DSM 23236]